MPDIKTLETFRSVVNHGSFNAAAEEMGVSVSTVSLQMRNLETFAGMLLFDRGRKPLPLTRDGLAYLDRVDAVLEAWSVLKPRKSAELEEGHLHMGTVHTALAGVMPAALKCIHARFPKLIVTITPGLSHELEARLLAGQMDCACLSLPDMPVGGLEYRQVISEPLVVIVPADHPHTRAPECLRQGPYIRFNPRARVGALIEKALRRQNLKLASAMEIDTLDGVVALVENGLGVSVIPLSRAARLPASIRVMDLAGDAERHLGLAFPKVGRQAHLIEAIHECFRTAHDGAVSD
ncbi:LysR substrate-binding domain-containing protein [Alphaproteobacteria bacterium LSUCC0684]